MKPRPHRDFFVSARSYGDEYDESLAPLFEDCYLLMLNNAVSITFAPDVEPDALVLPLDDGDPRTVAEARSVIVYSSRYVVTSSDVRDGEVRRVVGSGELEGFDAAVFYVSSARFGAFICDLRVIEERTCGSIPSSDRASTFAHLSVIDFIKRVVLDSSELGVYERTLLGPPAASNDGD